VWADPGFKNGVLQLYNTIACQQLITHSIHALDACVTWHDKQQCGVISYDITPLAYVNVS